MKTNNFLTIKRMLREIIILNPTRHWDGTLSGLEMILWADGVSRGLSGMMSLAEDIVRYLGYKMCDENMQTNQRWDNLITKLSHTSFNNEDTNVEEWVDDVCTSTLTLRDVLQGIVGYLEQHEKRMGQMDEDKKERKDAAPSKGIA